MKIDIHTHVLPGIDDGAKNWDICLQMLSKSAECGVTKVIATPHYIPWKKKVNGEQIKQLCKEAEEKLLEKHGISMDIYPGHEIYYSIEILEKLKNGEVLTLAGSRYILVEFEPEVSYQTVLRAVKDFWDAGYIPILAHVERYRCIQHSDRMEALKEMGALFQMNVESFQRGIFDANSRWAKKCLLKGWIDFLASDMHNMKNRTPMSNEKLRWVQKRLSPDYQKELLYGNSKEILP